MKTPKFLKDIMSDPSAESGPLLLAKPAPEWVSVFDACAQASFTAINKCMKVDDQALADEFLKTADGKAFMKGLKGYAMFVLGKTI